MSWDWHTSKGDGGKTFDPAMDAFTGKYAELTLIIDRQRARIEKLEAQLAEAKKRASVAETLIENGIHKCTIECVAFQKSHLQLTLDRIEAAIGLDNFSMGANPDGGFSAEYMASPLDGGYEPDYICFHGTTWAEAAEAAADWAEAQKGEADE